MSKQPKIEDYGIQYNVKSIEEDMEDWAPHMDFAVKVIKRMRNSIEHFHYSNVMLSVFRTPADIEEGCPAFDMFEMRFYFVHIPSGKTAHYGRLISREMMEDKITSSEMIVDPLTKRFNTLHENTPEATKIVLAT